MTYYNTNKESGETLTSSQGNTQSQENCILTYFRGGTYALSAPHNLEFLFDYKVPITSIRRALSNLEKGGKLIKTDKMVMGNYGKMVHTWRIKEVQMELNYNNPEI